MKKCLLIDDNPSCMDVMRDYIRRSSHLVVEEEFSNPVEALRFLENQRVELLFLDVEMDEMTGIEFLNLLQAHKFHSLPLVILTTGYQKYAIEGYDFRRVISFLHKPFSYEQFLKSIAIFEERVKDYQNHIVLKQRKKRVKVYYDDIGYILGNRNHVVITNTKDVDEDFYMTISEVEKLLPQEQFIRINKNCIVPLSRISVVSSTYLKLNQFGCRFPVGKIFREKVKHIFENH